MEPRVELAQLSWLCPCGRSIELPGLGCCRPCYHRRYHSLRFFGGFRDEILRRDRFHCRGCGADAGLVVHHRREQNERRSLITLCLRCHVRVHRWLALRRWVPEVLVQLWREMHAGEPLQLQFSFRARPSNVKSVHDDQ